MHRFPVEMAAAGPRPLLSWPIRCADRTMQWSRRRMSFGVPAPVVHGILLSFGLLSVSCSKNMSSGNLHAPVIDRKHRTGIESLVDVAATVVHAAPYIDEVWPGYWAPDQAFLIYEPERVALLVSPVPPGGAFAPVDSTLLPAELTGRAYSFQGSLPGLEGTFATDYAVGRLRVTAVALESAGGLQTMATLFHEGFHTYQDRHFSRTVGDARGALAEGYVESGHLAAPEFRALAEVERRILASALSAPEDSLMPLLKQYLAVRRIRTENVPEAIRKEERQVERKEGSAHLVGLEAALLAAQGTREALADSLAPYLTRPLDSVAGDLPGVLIRWRVYGTGAALGFLLDRLGEAWRPHLESGAAFDDLLANAVRFDSADTQELAEPALQRFGFAELLRNASTRSALDAHHTLDAFYALAPVRLVVEFTAPVEDGEGRSIDMHFSSGAGGFSQPAQGVLAIPDPVVFTSQLPTGSIVVRGRPVLQDMRGMPRARFVILLGEVPPINGRGRLSPGVHRLDRLMIQTDGVQLSLQGPLSIEVDRDSITVRIDSTLPD